MDDHARRHRPGATFGQMAPSYSFRPYAAPNGLAVAAAVLGFVALVAAFPIGPFGPLPGVLGGVGTVVLAVAARRRLAERPWIGGGRLAVASFGLAALAGLSVVTMLAT